jgi:hypothetical protein
MAEADPLNVEQAQALVQRKRRAGEGDPQRLELAQALSDLARAFERADREAEALGAAQESVAALSPAFLADPRRFASPMRALVGQYVALARRRGEHPDEAMLGPIAQALGELTRAEDAEEDG